jgi:hypothetical protein
MKLEEAIEIATEKALRLYNSLQYLKDRGYKDDYEKAKKLADALWLIAEHYRHNEAVK